MSGSVNTSDILNAAILKPQNSIGIYFLIKHKTIVYVGKAKNIMRRIGDHISENKKDFDSYSAIWCDENELSDCEALYIHKFNPKYNKGVAYSERINTLGRLSHKEGIYLPALKYLAINKFGMDKNINKKTIVDCKRFSESIQQFKDSDYIGLSGMKGFLNENRNLST